MLSEDDTGQLLLTLCRNELSKGDRQRAAWLLERPVDWSRLARLASLHGVAGLVRHNLAVLPVQVPEPASQVLQQAATQVAFTGMLQMRQLERMVRALQAAGVRCLVLKGYGLAVLVYSDPFWRPSSDLDLLVGQDQVESARAVLEPEGMVVPSQKLMAYQLAQGYHLSLVGEPLAGEPMLLELHWDLEARGLFELDLDALWARAETFPVGETMAWRFSPEDTLLYLALHMRKHRFIGLRWLCDVAELLRQFEGQLDWNYTMSTARRAGLRTLLHTTLSLAARDLQAPVPAEVLEGLRPTPWRERLLQRLLTTRMVMTPLETSDEGWTRLAVIEILLLDRLDTMAWELRYRLLPPPEKLGHPAARDISLAQRAVMSARRLLARSTTLLGRSRR
jgi:hypothetical protein